MVCENEEVWGLILRTVNSHSFYLGNKAEKVGCIRLPQDQPVSEV